MKKAIYAALPLSMILTCCSPVIYQSEPQYVATDPNQQPGGQQTDQVFYDELSPYGQWINYPDYGYVWQPDVDADFRPYDTNGYWVYSDDGWTWVSNYSWGWAAFHYGRWFYDDNYGWLWMPGDEWAPAWVTWGQSGDYYGWAPMPPRVNYGGNWRPRNEDWNFVPAQNITRVNVNVYLVRNNITVINHATIIDNGHGDNRGSNKTIYNRGPRVDDVEHRGNLRVTVYKVNGGARPGQSLGNNQVTVYRPVIRQNSSSGSNKPVPRKVVGYKPKNNPNPNQPNPGRGNGRESNPNPNQPNQKPDSGKENNPNPNQPGQKPGNGHGNNPNPNQPNQRPGNGQGNNQNPGQPNQRADSGRRSNPNPNQPGQKPGNGQGNNPNPNQPNRRPASGQGNKPDPNRPNRSNPKKSDSSNRHPKKVMTTKPTKQD